MRKFFSLVVALSLGIALWALDNVPYVDMVVGTDAEGHVTVTPVAKTANNVTVITNSSATLNAGWYLVSGVDVQTAGLICNGAVHLILADGAKLTATGASEEAGIKVSGVGISLTIYGQAAQTGELIATGGGDYLNGAAGIGGRNGGGTSDIIINGGIVTATSGDNAAGIGGGKGGSASRITINGGEVTATGDNGAGIGGGNGGSASGITINAGTVTAKSYYNGAGIGSTGGICSDITINGGIVKASCERYNGAGIGGGWDGSASGITINGGEVTANGGGDAAGIGGGGLGGASASNITINGGTVTATGRGKGAGIGGGLSGSASDITINGGEVTANGGGAAAGIGGGLGGSASGITINGGEVTANGGGQAAGIGGGPTGSASNITINDGEVTATGGEMAAGIGGGYEGSASGIIIKGGTVTATGGDGNVNANDGSGAGIGGGGDGSASDITIYGGIVTATGGAAGGSGIGGGAALREDVAGSDIEIKGGTVIATGGEYAAGIGGGGWGSCSDITISGGTVTAIGGISGAGIGSGIAFEDETYASNITISGGSVTATGGEGADGIGRGKDVTESNIKIIPASLPLLADDVKEPTTFIAHAGNEEITTKLAGMRFVTTEPRVRTNYAADKDAYYSTFYFGSMPLKLESEDVTMYTAALVQSGAETMLGLYEIEGDILPAATPVIIKAADAEKVHFTPYYGEVEELTIANDLTGVDEATSVAANTVYTLAAEDNILAFYKFSGTEIPAHKGYLQLPAGVSAPRRISFGSNVVTGMENVNDNSNANVNTNKVLRDGQLLIRKNGHLYNAQGVVVE